MEKKMKIERNRIPKIVSFVLLFIVTVLLSSGCDNTQNFEDDLIPDEDGMSVIKLYLTDTPVKRPEVSKVFVHIKSILAEHTENGWLTIADFGEPGKTYDLMELQNGKRAELGGFPIPFGKYKKLKMIVGTENEIEVDEGDGPVMRPLKTHKNRELEVKIEHTFIIADSGVHELTFDFDAKKSVIIMKGMLCEIIDYFDNVLGKINNNPDANGQGRKHPDRCDEGTKHHQHRHRCGREKETCYFLEPHIKIVDSLSLSISKGVPTLTLPDGVPDAFIINKSNLLPPPRVNSEYVPIGSIYNIELDINRIEGLDPVEDSGGSVFFPEGTFAEIHYRYDKTKLQEAGLAEDFMVWYYNDGSWYPVERVEVDTENGEVIAYTNHFTPFVLTAMPVGTGSVAEPPACIVNDYPAGIGGSGTAAFTVVDANFKYYQDRNYTIIPTTDFSDLGFEGALGISTCNGGSPCGPVTSHKQFTGTNYISFVTQRDIDVYLMYDSRGGVDRFDTSEDAPWIAGDGFVNTGKFIETTDAVHYYTVYKKSYAAGEVVTLHGNRNGITGPTAIDTNYWLVVKPQGVTATAPAGSVCTIPDENPPAPVENLTAFSGQNSIILQWSNPVDNDFAGVVIRRSSVSPPALVSEGEEPTGVVVHPEVYRDEGLSLGTTYYYTVFALDKDQNISAGRTIVMSTALDLDGDGLSDVYENTVTYATGSMTDHTNPDTDGDGIDDGVEVANGTDPTNGDVSAPVISAFTLTSGDPTTFPIIEFSLEGNDDTGITGWLITKTADPPLSTSLGWQTAKPSEMELFASGSYSFYAWARDAAGNVSSPVTPVSVTLEGINIPKFAYTLNQGSSIIDICGIDKSTGELTDISSVENSYTPRQIHIHPGGRWAYVENSNTIRKYDINSATGELIYVSNISPDISLSGTRMDSLGEYFYIYNSQKINMYNINSVNGELQYINQVNLGDNASIASLFTVPTDDGGVLVPVTTSTQVYDQNLKDQCVDSCCTDQTIFGPVNMCVATIYWSWELALLRYLNCRDNVCPSQAYRTEYSDYMRLYDLMPFYSLKVNINAPRIRGSRGIVSPYGNFAYMVNSNSNTISSYSVDLSGGDLQHIGDTSIGSNPLDFQIDPEQKYLYLNYSGLNIISIYAIDPGTGQLSLISDQAVDNIPVSIRLDPTGRILFSLDGQGQTIASYRLNPDGTLHLTDYRSTIRQPKKMAILEYHGGNDPPVARITTYNKTRYFDGSDFKETFKHFVQAGEGIEFNTHGSLDPDAAQCGADPNNYHHHIELISKPAASAMTQADIDIWETAMGSPPYKMMYFYAPGKRGRFTPDVPGEYEFEYRFTDDPGSCDDIAKTSSSRIVITAVNQMRDSSNYLLTSDPPGAAPAGNAVLEYDWEKYYDLEGSGYSYNRIYKYKKRKYYRARVDSLHHKCFFWTCEDHIDAECISPYENSEKNAINYCLESLPDTFNSGFLHWSYRHNYIIWTKEYYHTTWYWWE